MMADDLRVEVEIELLAREIALQRSPHSALEVAASPHEIARALFLTGWRPPIRLTKNNAS